MDIIRPKSNNILNYIIHILKKLKPTIFNQRGSILRHSHILHSHSSRNYIQLSAYPLGNKKYLTIIL